MPSEIGLERFAKLLEAAKEEKVRIAFENTEGEEYLEGVMQKFKNCPEAGFCFDSGHEMCYNCGGDLISRYGVDGKIIAVHLNDNMGQTGESITWLDDSHILPFDGIVDFIDVARRMKLNGYKSEWLTFELTVKNKPERNTHDRYANMSYEDFLKEAKKRADRFYEIYMMSSEKNS